MAKDKFIIWDIDGVKYDYHRLPNYGFYTLCDTANAIAARQLLPQLSMQEAESLATESFAKFHDCYGAFMSFAAQSGLSDEQFRLSLFKDYHKILFKMLEDKYPDFFDDSKQMVEAFRATSARICHAALSHSHMEEWGIPVLSKIGTLPFFEPSALLGLDQYDFVRKSESIAPLQMALDRLNAAPEQTFFAEDSLTILERSADMSGLRLAYIHHGKPLDKLPEHITVQFAKPEELVLYVDAQPVRNPRRISNMKELIS